MPRKPNVTRRRTYSAAIGGFAVLGSVFALIYANNARTENEPKPFKSGITISKTGLFCSGSDDRVYLSTDATYGKPVGRSGRVRQVTEGKVTVKVLKRKGSSRALASATERGRIDFKVDQRGVSRSYSIRFGARQSKRILLYAYGKTVCEHRRSNQLLVKLHVTERSRPSSSGSGNKGGSRQQSRRHSSLKRIVYRSCLTAQMKSCSEPTEKEDGQSPGREERQPDSSESGTDQGSSPYCVPPEHLDSRPGSSSGDYSQRYRVGTVESDEINETSGLAASRKNSGVLWLHNDSGDTARLFAINTTGRLLATYSIDAAAAVDWEDIAVGPAPAPGTDYLYIADIGDNNAVRGSVTLYRVEEPTVSSTQPELNDSQPISDSIQIDYPDGPRDAETLMTDPNNGDIYVVSKRELLSRIYRLPADSWSSASATLDYIGQLTWGGAVGGDISPSGSEILIKSYLSVSLYERTAGSGISDALSGSATLLPYTAEPQGEAIAFCGQGSGYFTLSEGLDQPLYYYR